MTTTSTVTIARFNPYTAQHRDNHLEFSVCYQAANGQFRWASGVLSWALYEQPQRLLAEVLRFQTDFVKQRWLRIEVCIPNRDHYGNLKPGFIQDTGILLATRQTN